MILHVYFIILEPMYRPIILLCFSFLLLVVACGRVAVDADLGITQQAVASSQTEEVVFTPSATTVAPTKMPAPILSPLPSATLPATASPTPEPPPSCPDVGQADPFDPPANNDELYESMLAFINAGGSWEDLWLLLEGMGIEYDSIEADMNGDGLVETAVYTVISHDYTFDHSWWLFTCTTGQYELVYSTHGVWVFHEGFLVDELNNDDRLDIIIIKGFAGSACALEPSVWSWQDDRIVDLSPRYSQLGCSADDQILFQDLDGDDVKEMILVGKTVGHLDYSPPRGITETFALRDTQYELEETVFAPADLLIYLLDDAQKALDAGDLPRAVDYYTQASYEPMPTAVSYYLLLNPAADPIAYQHGFALFRLFVLQLVLGDEEAAQAALAKLDTLYVEGEFGHEFTLLAHIFQDNFRVSNSLEEACEQVSTYISHHYAGSIESDPPSLSAHFYWGANMVTYSQPASFCPVFAVP